MPRRCGPVGRILTEGAVHHAQTAAFPKLVDGADGVDGGVERAPRVEVLLDDREQICAAAAVFVDGSLRIRRDPGVGYGFVGGHALLGVDGQAPLDELAGRLADAAPVFLGSEGVVCDQNGLHLFEVGFFIEWRIAAKEKIGDYADRPDVTE